jgi:hypothetical protein
MNEWNATTPIIIITESPTAARFRRRPLRPWSYNLVAALALFLASSGVLLLIGQAVWQYTIQDMIPPIAVLAAGYIVVVMLIYVIAWRYGRLS